jgi:hypothetical protein
MSFVFITNDMSRVPRHVCLKSAENLCECG